MEEPKRGLGEAMAALKRLRETGDTKHVFEITRALGSGKPPPGYARLLTTPQGGRMAYERVELCERFGDDAWLRASHPARWARPIATSSPATTSPPRVWPTPASAPPWASRSTSIPTPGTAAATVTPMTSGMC
uniref:Uncharacterized protein n=1 Tax=Phenylobacterium glaciei TaxID=2803784 RepID=A0A974P154_9CAUL|nr:hypothetical protein JKL49_19935 [Phenylobacterium glaciei]